MKQTVCFALLLLTVLIFPGCKKEQENGGISFSFIANEPIQNHMMSVSLSQQAYGTPVVSAGTRHSESKIMLTDIKPGTYYWTCRIDYSTPAITAGTYYFEGSVIIEKGKIMYISVEN